MINGNPIEKTKGPCLILAGAGTGKTYTIVEKVKHMIDAGIYKPERIVCIAFSNEAANNLSIRIGKATGLEVGNGKTGIIVRTFHGFGADLLRKYGDKIGMQKEFKILDPDQAKVVLHRNLKVNVNECHQYIGTIGTAKDLGIKLEEFEEYLQRKLSKYGGVDLQRRLESLQFELQTMHLKSDSQGKQDIFKQIKRLRDLINVRKFVNSWRAYEKLKQKNNYQDYSDLNKNALLLLEKCPEIALDFDYIIVDEFQDTNKVQLDLICKLVRSGNITVVGDLNQSIYRFRGAYRKNINLFKEAFGVTSADIFNLDKSYRSSNKILRTAHKLILNNYENPADCLFVENVHNRDGELIEVYEMRDAREEARKVVELVLREKEAGIPEEEICVMFRTHQYGKIIKKALEQSGIAYCSVAKASLLKQKSVRTARDYLVILNKLKKKEKGGEQEWWDLVYQLDFAQEDLIKIGRLIKDFLKSNDKNRRENENSDTEGNNYRNDKTGVEGLDNNIEGLKCKVEEGNKVLSVYLFNELTKINLSESGKMAARILIEKMKTLISFSDKRVSEIIKETFRVSGLLNEQKTREEKEIMLNLNKFYEIAKTHEDIYDSDLDNFLYYLEILESLGIEIEASELEEAGVRLMTSHATKGLEYKTVIITNMAQKRFPIERYISNGLIPTELLPEVREETLGLDEDEQDDFIVSYEKHHQMLEERRLAYVSFTRAKEKLILTFADSYVNKEFYPSRFLNEIEYRSNGDIVFYVDKEQKYVEPEIEIKTAASFSGALKSGNFDELIAEIVNSSVENKKTKEHGKFSPSALLLFEECQKQFEYKYVYNMPEKKTVSWEAMRLGSFVHLVLERGVSSSFESVEEFLQLAREMSMEEDWESVSLEEAELLVKVFFERNKGRYGKQSKTEQYLPLTLAGMDFIGFADRIDFCSSGAEIVDYKTGKTAVTPNARNWQLGFYALAAKEKYGNVSKVTLEMLKQDKPLEFEIDERGNANCVSSDRISGFNIYEVEQELIKAAHSIQDAYKNGFKPCPIEKNCEFCSEYVYGL